MRGDAVIRSDELDALNAALSAAQGEFEAISKDSKNPFFKSKYAALPQVVEAATPILAKHGLAVWQGPDTNAAGKEVLWTVTLHSSGQYIGSAMEMRPVKDDPQAQGSAITYARRYAYMAALGLVADEDDDGEKAMERNKPVSRPKPASKGKETPKPSDAPSVAANGPSGDAGGNATDGDPLITTEQLEELATLYREKGSPKAAMRQIMKEVGAQGRQPNELTEDQGRWVILKLREHEAPNAASA